MAMGKAKKGKDKQEKKPGKGKEAADKVVRDSFTMPKQEHQQLRALKAHCLKNGIAVKKSELLRAGLLALEDLGDDGLFKLIERLERVKTGRPNKSEDTAE
jgi:hypothetical protein